MRASSGHITNHKQSILETFDIYARNITIQLKQGGQAVPIRRRSSILTCQWCNHAMEW